MNPVYIRATGIHAEHFSDLHALEQVLNQQQEQPCLTDVDIHQDLNLRLNKTELGAIAREDRSILNDLSTSILNAAGDMLAAAGKPNGLDFAENQAQYKKFRVSSEQQFELISDQKYVDI